MPRKSKATELAPVERDAQGRIVKGALNPGGRVKDERELVEALREEGAAVGKVLIRLAKKGNVKAIEVFLNRAYGKAKQVVELSGAGGGPLRIDLKNLSQKDLDALEAIVARATSVAR